MRALKKLFGVKEKLWEGADEKQWQNLCAQLGDSGIWTQAFRVNQETPKCSGNCSACASACNFDEDTPVWEKMGSGFSDDLLKEKPDQDLYAIYVLKEDLQEAGRILDRYGV